jgi:hypothetical protein
MAKKFEYKIIEPHKLEDNKGEINKTFVQLGQEGWELVGTISGFQGNGKLYFKRETESNITHKQENSNYDISR